MADVSLSHPSPSSVKIDSGNHSNQKSNVINKSIDGAAIDSTIRGDEIDYADGYNENSYCDDGDDGKHSSMVVSIQSPLSQNTISPTGTVADAAIQTSASFVSGQLTNFTLNNPINSKESSRNKRRNSKSNSCTKSKDLLYITASPQQTGDRETWDKKVEFLLAVIGFAVDLGNVWRFPYVCYRNGGGAFLIPYVVMLLFGGLPLFYLELALGQYYRSGCLTIWKKLCPIMKGIGYAICFTDLYMAMYYNTVIAWAFYYLIESIASLATFELPWTRCDNEWNTEKCQTLYERRRNTNISDDKGSQMVTFSPAQEYFERQVLESHRSSGIESIGSIKWSLAMCLLAVFIIVYFSIWKGVKSTGKAVWVTATMPYFVLFILLIRGITLEGSMEGIKYYLYPQWDKLHSLQVWIDAATQIFFSLGPGFGTLLALSSYNKFHNNCYKDAIFTSSINCLTSFIAGFAIFSVLGYMAKVMDKDVSSVATGGPGLVFVVYPEAIATMHGSVLWSILFFVMLITLGLDSTFGGLEAMITGLCDEYPSLLRKNREIFVAVLILFIYLCALSTTTYGGHYIVDLLDNYGTSLSVLFIVFVETIAVCWCYGAEKFANQIKEMIGFLPGFFWRMCWTYISPLFLGFMFFAALFKYKHLTVEGYIYPEWSIVVGWLITLSSLLCIPVYGIYHYLSTPGTPMQRLVKSFRPEEPNTDHSLPNCEELAQINSQYAHV